MKIKDPFENSIKENPPLEQRDRVLKHAAGILGRATTYNAEPSFFARLFRPAFGISLAGACVAAAAVFYVQRSAQNTHPAPAFRYEPEMVRNAEMLDDLEVLLKLDGLEKLERGKWPKKKS